MDKTLYFKIDLIATQKVLRPAWELSFISTGTSRALATTQRQGMILVLLQTNFSFSPSLLRSSYQFQSRSWLVAAEKKNDKAKIQRNVF